MSGKKEVTYEAVNNFIIAIKCCAITEIERYLAEYDPVIVNRLETQTRQPSLYFSAILIDHEQSYQIMRMLLAHGANPHFKDNNQQTVLFYVCREGKKKCLDLLLEHGLSLSEQDAYGQTPLYYAAKQNRMNIVARFIERKVDVNSVDRIAGQTALFYAARDGHFEMCKVLVEAGCNPSIQDTAHKMASHYAKKYGKNEVFDYLSGQLQNMKDQRRVMGQSSRQESNQEDKLIKTKKKKEIVPLLNTQQKVAYRLCRSDALGNFTELTLQEFQEFIVHYPELEEMINNPDEMDMSVLQEIKVKDHWIKVASKVLTICWKSKGGFYFHEPVDPSKYNIDDYFEIIAQPMDFGTIRHKLSYNVYNNVTEFVNDMRLVFDNCVKYNGLENPIAKQAIEIKMVFEENMKQSGYFN